LRKGLRQFTMAERDSVRSKRKPGFSGETPSLLLGVALATAPFFFIFQGLDFTDMGYILASSRDVLADPANVPSFSTFLSIFINGLWMKLADPFGLLGIRAGYGIVCWGIFACSYWIMKDHIPGNELLAWLLLTFIYTQRSSWISYNNLTSLFAVASLLLLYRGFRKDDLLLFFLSGAVNAAGVFVRLPNILMIGFAFLPLIANRIASGRHGSNRHWMQAVIFLAGWISGMIFFLAALHVSGYLPFFLESFQKLRAAALEGSASHSLENLASLFFSDYKRVLSTGILLAGAMGGVAVILGLSKPAWYAALPSAAAGGFLFGEWHYIAGFRWNKVFIIIASLAFLVQAWAFLIPVKLNWSSIRYRRDIRISRKRALFFLLAACLLAASTWYLWTKNTGRFFDPVFGVVYVLLFLSILENAGKRQAGTVFLYLAALALLVSVPLGSDNGIRNAVYGLWLALPLALHLLWSGHFFPFPGSAPLLESFLTHASRRLRIPVLLLLAAAACAGTYRYTYRDTSERIEMRFQVDHPKLGGIFTTKERAEAVSQVLDELKQHVKPGDFLLGYHTVSTLYWLTETSPYLGNSWPFLNEPEDLKKKLAAAKNERPSLPVAVRAKFSLQNFEWPRIPFRNKTERYSENWKIMKDFLERNNYRKVWGNNVFEILLPAPVHGDTGESLRSAGEGAYSRPPLEMNDGYRSAADRIRKEIQKTPVDGKKFLDNYSSTGTYLNYEKVKSYRNSKTMQLDSSGIPMILYGKEYYYNSAVVAQFTLAIYSRFVTGNLAAWEKFQKGLEKLISLQSPEGGFPNMFPFRHGFTGELLEPGWISATASGQALSALARAFALTKDSLYLESGERVFHFLTVRKSQGGSMTDLSALDKSLDSFVFFEEFSTKKESCTLEGHVSVLLGLSDWKETLHDSGAGLKQKAEETDALLQRGIDTLRLILPYYDIDGLGASNLAHYTLGRKEPYISRGHHQANLSLLHAVAEATGDSVLRSYAEKWSKVYGQRE